MRRAKLSLLSIEGMELFGIAYRDDAMVCSWSQEHVFAVRQSSVIGAIEGLVENCLAGRSDRLRSEFLNLGAKLIRKDPRFALLQESEMIG